MDALFFLRHSGNDDLEIRYALRSIDRHMPWVRKVWIFGDRPSFLADDRAVVEHLPHESIAWVGPYKTPVRNFFLMYYLTALIPEIEEEYVRFSDDFILVSDLSPERARQIRYLQDLSKGKDRSRGLWKDGLWRTHDTLKRLGYPSLNFETHTPVYLKKRWVLEAFRDFRDYVTEDRWYGPTALTAILNHAWRRERMPLVRLGDERSRAGFYGTAPSYEEVVKATDGRLFLNFNEGGFGEGTRKFLAERFPEPCKYEQRPRGPGRVAGSATIDATADDKSEPSSRDAPLSTERLAPATVARFATAFESATGSKWQMSPVQYFRVTLEILRQAPCNLLVFGAGRDTELYTLANAGGRTVVLEHREEWLRHIEWLPCEGVPVGYSTQLGRGLVDEPCPLPSGLPAWVLEEHWKLILIDGPEGNAPHAPGRQQSISLASRLAGPETTLFLHDAERPHERRCADRYFGPAVERMGDRRQLAVFRGTAKQSESEQGAADQTFERDAIPLNPNHPENR